MADAAVGETGNRADAMLEAIGLTVRFDGAERPALADVDLRIDQGECVAVIGRSGSGKSTLLNALGLLATPTAGELLLGDVAVSTASERQLNDLRRTALAFVFQSFHLLPDRTVRENVTFGTNHTRGTGTPIDPDAILSRLGLQHRADAKAKSLSGGEAQRVAIGRALMREPLVILADEPTGNLDSATSRDVMDLLRAEARAANATLVVVTHDAEVAAACDRIVELADGRIVSDHRRQIAYRRDTGSNGLADRRPTGAEGASGAPQGQSRSRTTRWFRHTIGDAAANQRDRLTRLAAIPVTISLALVVTTLGLMNSASAQVTAAFDADRARQLLATATAPESAGEQPDAAPHESLAGQLDLANLIGTPGVISALAFDVWDSVPVQTLTASDATVLTSRGSVWRSPLLRIRWPNGQAGHELRSNQVVLGADLATRLHITQIDVAPEIEIGERSYEIAGIVTESEAPNLMGAAIGPNILVPGVPTSATLAVATAQGAAAPLAGKLAAIVDPYQRLTIETAPVPSPEAARGRLERSVAAALGALAAVSSLTALVSIVSMGLFRVLSRRSEIGLRRALGWSRAEIAGMIGAETTMTACVGAVVGCVVGLIAILIVTLAARWRPVFDPSIAGVAIAAGVLAGMVGSIAPAIAAARIDPAQALRDL